MKCERVTLTACESLTYSRAETATGFPSLLPLPRNRVVRIAVRVLGFMVSEAL